MMVYKAGEAAALFAARERLDAERKPAEPRWYSVPSLTETEAEPLDEPIAVRAQRLARILDVSTRKVREMTSELPHVRHEGVVLFPLDAVREHLNAKARKRLEGR